MVETIFEPLWNPESPQDPYPKNWQELNDTVSQYPKQFSEVLESAEVSKKWWKIYSWRIYRSGLVLPNHLWSLRELWIQNIISLLEVPFLSAPYIEEYNLEKHWITFFKAPILQRKELTSHRCLEIVKKIQQVKRVNRNVLVHCSKGAVRTGMVIAMHRIFNEKKSVTWAVCESITHRNTNLSALREITTYWRTTSDQHISKPMHWENTLKSKL